MSLNYNYIQSRIQLKHDIQVNWDTTNYVALDGELIIYDPDYDSVTNPTGYTYARLKVGDGTTQIKNLPFIDSGTVNGKIIEEVVQIYNQFSDFPPRGDAQNHATQQSLYVDKHSGKIFYWNSTQNDYTQIGGVVYNISTLPVQVVSTFNSGQVTQSTIDNHTLVITYGTNPTLTTNPITVVTGLTAQ